MRLAFDAVAVIHTREIGGSGEMGWGTAGVGHLPTPLLAPEALGSIISPEEEREGGVGRRRKS